ncbi:putative nuclease HARBI1 isoform X2 [Harpegnathos saltator]|uniref:putative nuclease HARBI1 isoform X2 n=1 Tax=Harpegnathos saltator TaxID=610380 RepID=UPI000DBED73A|nr:putative nuclease HARBI1 isoform X2 [Harpegnathos saltator]
MITAIWNFSTASSICTYILSEDRQAAREKFRTAQHPFISAIGAIDCTYVSILAPQLHEEAYVNHWGDHCLNVQAICDPDLKILNINARYPGVRHDAYIWANCATRRVMERWYMQGERKTWLIGDDGYGLEPWLMTPLKHEQPGTPRFNYNEELCSTRSCIERLTGVLKSEFRCLSAQKQLMYEPGLAGRIVNACAVLHNMRIHHRIYDIDVDPAEVEAHRVANMPNPAVEIDHGEFLQGRALATRIQDSFIAQR